MLKYAVTLKDAHLRKAAKYNIPHVVAYATERARERPTTNCLLHHCQLTRHPSPTVGIINRPTRAKEGKPHCTVAERPSARHKQGKS